MTVMLVPSFPYYLMVSFWHWGVRGVGGYQVPGRHCCSLGRMPWNWLPTNFRRPNRKASVNYLGTLVIQEKFNLESLKSKEHSTRSLS